MPQTLHGKLAQPNVRANISTQKAQAIFDVRTIRSGNKKIFQINFTKDNFELEIKRYKLIIPHTEHNLGERYLIDKITRSENGAEGNIWCQFKVLINGDFLLWTDEPFDGNLIISEI